MPKLAYIAQPTQWMDEKRIQPERTRIARALSKQGYIVLNPKYEMICRNNATLLFTLGEAIKKLSMADVVLFCDEWKDDANCRILHNVCAKYKIKTISEDDIFTEDYS